MPRDTVAVVSMSVNAVNNVTTGAGTAINATNGAKITPTRKTGSLLIRATNEITNATKTLSIGAGDNPPALRSALGALTLTLPASGDVVIAIESARFLQSDGTLEVNFQSASTGYIWAIELPDGAA